MSPNGTRAGVILYDSDPQLRIGLDDYSTFSEFYTLLSDLSLQSGGRELHKVNINIPIMTLYIIIRTIVGDFKGVTTWPFLGMSFFFHFWVKTVLKLRLLKHSRGTLRS